MRRRQVGQVLVAAGLVGAIATATGAVAGLAVLGDLDRSLDASIDVTADALVALSATIDAADGLVDELSGTLGSAELAARAGAGGVEAAVEVLDGAAVVTGDDVAGSLEAVEDALPALVDVASVVDSTLSALDRLPLGPTYDPDVPFDDAVRRVQVELDGLPAALRAEADLLRDGAAELADVGRAARFLADDLGELATTLRDTRAVLTDVAATADDAAEVLASDTGGLQRGLTGLRALVAVGGLALVIGQLVPIGAGWLLLDPARLAALVAGATPTDD